MLPTSSCSPIGAASERISRNSGLRRRRVDTEGAHRDFKTVVCGGFGASIEDVRRFESRDSVTVVEYTARLEMSLRSERTKKNPTISVS